VLYNQRRYDGVVASSSSHLDGTVTGTPDAAFASSTAAPPERLRGVCRLVGEKSKDVVGTMVCTCPCGTAGSA